ncbi:MAG: U32 family peptidase [Candidatus Cloacimonetes bacterium]|nr:U32 family peptidase [Candidatus Cloacimonadota bacterium]
MEITSPGGDLEKIKYAILYGADAVYCGYNLFGLRAAAKNLDQDDLCEAIRFAHDHDAMLYLTLNAYLKNEDYPALADFLIWLKDSGIDAVIVADPGVFDLVQSKTNIPIHISTQTNICSIAAAKFWHDKGAKRIVPARELSFRELLEIKDALPELEIESFIHGAMCVAYSGRCLLSAYLNKRSANSGACTQVCRWDWALTQKDRPGQYFPIQEDQYGSYIMSSKDLCLLDKMPLLKEAGIHAGKIEGRMKSLYYVAQISRVYKAALALAADDTQGWELLGRELQKVSHRPYWQGFYDFDDTDAGIVSPDKGPAYTSESQYCGKVIAHENGKVIFDALAKISVGDTIDIIFPDLARDLSLKVEQIYDDENNAVTDTRPNFRYGILAPVLDTEGALIRKCESSL